ESIEADGFRNGASAGCQPGTEPYTIRTQQYIRCDRVHRELPSRQPGRQSQAVAGPRTTIRDHCNLSAQGNRALASRGFALGPEALERFVANQTLRRPARGRIDRRVCAQDCSAVPRPSASEANINLAFDVLPFLGRSQ